MFSIKHIEKGWLVAVRITKNGISLQYASNPTGAIFFQTRTAARRVARRFSNNRFYSEFEIYKKIM